MFVVLLPGVTFQKSSCSIDESRKGTTRDIFMFFVIVFPRSVGGGGIPSIMVTARQNPPVQGVYVLGGKCPGGKCPGGISQQTHNINTTLYNVVRRLFSQHCEKDVPATLLQHKMTTL